MPPCWQCSVCYAIHHLLPSAATCLTSGGTLLPGCRQEGGFDLNGVPRAEAGDLVSRVAELEAQVAGRLLCSLFCMPP